MTEYSNEYERRFGDPVCSWAAKLLCCAVLMIGASGFVAAESPADNSEDWQFALTPYIWASALSGDVQVGRLPKTSVSQSVSDVNKTLDVYWAATFEARKNRWGVLVDAMYNKSSDSGARSRTGSGPIGATLSANANADLEQTIVSVAATYRVLGGQVPVDVLGGLRYNEIQANASIDASLFGQTGTVSRGGNQNWTDPYIGVRVQYPLNDNWSLLGYADVGGFGVESIITDQAIVGVDYTFSKTITGQFGYRYLNTNYDKSGVVYDIQYFGWYVAAGFHF